jgi:tripartite-type tricarboxylate transporter receptor subunit TctC
VARSAPDGYTLLLVTAANTINTALYDKLNFNFSNDFAPIATLGREPLVLAVHPSTPAKTLPEFIAYVRANSGKITMASAGNGSASHVSGELFNMLAGVNNATARTGANEAAPALNDVLGGQVNIYFSPLSGAIEQIRSRNGMHVRGLAAARVRPTRGGAAAIGR